MDETLPFLKTDFFDGSWEQQLEKGVKFILKNNSTFIIRRMNEDDIKVIVNLEKDIFCDPWSEIAFQFKLDNLNGNLSIIGTIEDEVVGYAVCLLVIDELHIDNLAIVSKVRRNGCAATILWTILKIAKLEKVTKCFLEVRRTNSAAIALYQKLGFKVVAIRKNYYVKEKEDALLMILDLP